MKDFILIFRMDILTPEAQPNADQMAKYMQQWTAWLDHIFVNGKLAPGGHHLSPASAAVVSPGGVTKKGPYAVNKESVAGYIVIHANDLDDAIAIAKKCPILNGEGTSVEVREAASS